jgi:hypothetical protein
MVMALPSTSPAAPAWGRPRWGPRIITSTSAAVSGPARGRRPGPAHRARAVHV